MAKIYQYRLLSDIDFYSSGLTSFRHISPQNSGIFSARFWILFCPRVSAALSMTVFLARRVILFQDSKRSILKLDNLYHLESKSQTMSLVELMPSLSSDEAALKFLRDRGCIRRKAPACPICHNVMTVVRTGRNRSPIFRCPHHHGQKMSQLFGSFWEHTRLSLPRCIMLAWLWAFKIPHADAVDATGLSQKCISTWYGYFQELCSRWLQRHHYKANPPEVKVELEASVIEARRARRDRLEREFKAKNRNSSEIPEGRVDEMLWRALHGKRGKTAFDRLFEHIAELYPH